MSSASKSAGVVLSRRHATALRQLKSEVARREKVQQALEASEQHYGVLLGKSRQMQEHLRRLSHELLCAQEEERKRISRDLHDQVGQSLTAINVKLTTLNRAAKVNASSLKTQLAGTQRLLEKSMTVVHGFARDLRPPLLDDLGLTPALHSFVKDFTKRTNIPIHCTVSAAVERLEGDKLLVLYRVTQEALTNVAKHARANLVRVRIQKFGGDVLMEIHDNGKSFQVTRAFGLTKVTRLGLLGMRERVEMVGGSFSVESAPGQGTTIRAQIPFRKVRRESAGAAFESVR